MFHNNYIGLISLLITISLTYGFFLLWNKKLKSTQLNLGIDRITKKEIQIALLVILLAFLFYLDFLRDYVFHNLSWRMDYQYIMEQGGSPEKYADNTDSWMVSLLGDTSSNTIYKLKYAASAFFIIIYAFVSHTILKLTYPKHNTFPYTLLIYSFGVLSMGLVFSFYFFTWPHEAKLQIYLIVMEIGHFLESSLPTLLSILGFKIYLSSQQVKPNE